MKLMNWRMTADIAADNLNPADSSAVKFYGTETHVEVYRLLLGILGAGGWLRAGSPGAALSGDVERAGSRRSDQHVRRRGQRDAARDRRRCRPEDGSPRPLTMPGA